MSEVSARPSEIFRADLLAGKVVVITGGGTGIGRSITEECLALGAKVAIGARKVDRLEAAAQEMRDATGGEVFAHALNIRDPESVEAFVAATEEALGPIDTLVNNAGGQFPAPAEMIPPKGWRAVIDTNLNGTWYMCQAVGQRMIDRGTGGHMVQIVANMWRGFPGMAHTGAARAGVVNLTKTLALEWAKHQIQVNAVAPGVIQSSGLDTYDDAVKEALFADLPKHVPLKRLGVVEDVAWSVVYLISPAGRFITGETICVDGGQAHWGTVFEV
ncbi:MAG: SDR family oxidoreductase [Bradymonadia bacterium]